MFLFYALLCIHVISQYKRIYYTEALCWPEREIRKQESRNYQSRDNTGSVDWSLEALVTLHVFVLILIHTEPAFTNNSLNAKRTYNVTFTESKVFNSKYKKSLLS